MPSTIYNVEIDMVLVEKIIMRTVLATVSYNCLLT